MKLRFRSAGIVALALGLDCARPGPPVELASGKPLPGASAQAIIESAQRTNSAVNEMVGL